jgi:HK97 gp10 family phage protein
VFRSRLPKIAAELAAKANGITEAGAELIVERAKERVPVGEGEVHLRDHIHVEPAEDGHYVVAGDGETFYGHIVEHGSVNAAPHPFLIPAAEESRKEVQVLAYKVGKTL